MSRKVMFKESSTVYLRWKPPEPNWKTLNTDGAVTGDQIASCGWLIRYNISRWIAGTHALGNCSLIIAEMQGVLDGVELARSKGIQIIIIRTDSKEVKEIITKDNHIMGIGSSLQKQIKMELSVYGLAKIGATHSLLIVFFIIVLWRFITPMLLIWWGGYFKRIVWL